MSKDMLGPLTRALVGVPVKMLGLVLDIANRLGSADVDGFYTDLAKFVREWKKQVTIMVYLCRLFEAETIHIGATDGTETLAKAGDVFTGYVDPDFRNWGLDVPDEETAEMPVTIHELVQDGAFADIYKSVGELLDDLCLTQAQIKKFCVDHRSKLRDGGYATFFLFKVDGKFFVANVHVYGVGRLTVYVFKFSYVCVWRAEFRHRFVFPQ